MPKILINFEYNMNEQQSIVPKDVNDFIDVVERAIVDKIESGEFVYREFDLKHTFTPGLYGRQITMLPGDRLTSAIHLTEHQFIISQGKVAVFLNGEKLILEAPYHEITKAGTRRVLMIPEDSEVPCIWTTFHATNIMPEDDSDEAKERAAEKIVREITEKHDNVLLNNIEKETYLLNQ